MKMKSILKMTSLLLIAAAMMMPTVADAQSRKFKKQGTTRTTSAKSAKQTPLYTELVGEIGSEGGAELKMNGTTGHYVPNSRDHAKRQLKLESYNMSTGRCVLIAYLKGKKIGKFEGKYENFCVKDDTGEEHWGEVFEGTFTNVINGAKLKFYLYAD